MCSCSYDYEVRKGGGATSLVVGIKGWGNRFSGGEKGGGTTGSMVGRKGGKGAGQPAQGHMQDVCVTITLKCAKIYKPSLLINFKDYRFHAKATHPYTS